MAFFSCLHVQDAISLFSAVFFIAKPRFSVIARQSERLGWHVSVASVRECDEFGASTVVEDVDAEPEKITSPFRTKWIVPMILPIILEIETPSISNKNLRQALSAYGKEHLLTDLILQDARTEAKAQLFGVAEENVRYAEGMKSELEKDGHVVELMYMSRKDTLHNVERLVIGEEMIHLKSATNGTLDTDERHQCWSKWKTDNYTLLVNRLRFKTQDSRFLHGVFFTPSFAQKTVPELQTFFMADACHLNFGKSWKLSGITTGPMTPSVTVHHGARPTKLGVRQRANVSCPLSR